MKFRIFIALLAVMLLGAGGYYAYGKFFTEAPSVVVSAPVARGNIEETVLATGQLKPAKLVAVGAQVSGRVLNLHVGLGQTVQTGELIAEIDSVTQVNALRTAEASLANVRAQRVEKEATLAQATRNLARQKQMVERRAVSQADYEEAEAEVKTTQAQISALDAQIVEAEVAVETAKANLGYTKITAPMDGTVLAVVSQEGQTVNASQTAPTIVILGQLDTMTVRVDVSEADIVRVKPGQRVFFNVLGDPDRRYETELRSIEPAPESIRSDSSLTSSSSSSSSTSSSTAAVYYVGVFDVPNAEGRLRTYMTAEVNIVIDEAKDALTIPSVALGKRGDDGAYTVQVVGKGGALEKRRVKIGLNDRSTAEVLSGLQEGEKVVTGVASGDGSTSSRRTRFMGL